MNNSTHLFRIILSIQIIAIICLAIIIYRDVMTISETISGIKEEGKVEAAEETEIESTEQDQVVMATEEEEARKKAEEAKAKEEEEARKKAEEAKAKEEEEARKKAEEEAKAKEEEEARKKAEEAKAKEEEEARKREEEARRKAAEEYILPESNSRYYSISELEKLDDKTLQMAINELYARRGRKFDTPSIREYFESKSWYTGTIDPKVFDSDESKYFNKYEKVNRQRMVQIRDSRANKKNR